MPMVSSTGTGTDTGELQQQLDTVRGEYEEFGRRVRAEVLRQHFHGSWCLPGSQAVLNDLGLPPIALTFTGHAYIRVDITNVDDAGDYDEACGRVVNAFEATCSDAGIEFELNRVDATLYQNEVDEL